MGNKSLFFILTFMILMVWSSNSFSLQEKTHQAINEHIAQNTLNGFSLNIYLIKNLGFKNGAEDVLLGVDAEGKNVSKEVFWWLGYGGNWEDDPVSDQAQRYCKYYFNAARNNNHFHNPRKNWREAGLDDSLPLPNLPALQLFCSVYIRQLPHLSNRYNGQSLVLWAQNPNQNVGDKMSWQDARKSYYIALTGRDFNGQVIASKTKERTK
jgi:hypothetical protein